MVSSDEINRRLEARRRGVKYQDPHERRRMGTESSNTRECPSCGTQNPPTAKFCVGCGEKLETPEAAPERETEKEYSPEIRGPEQPATEKPIQSRARITRRPDDFSKSRKLEPIVPPEPKTPEVESEKTPETEIPTNIQEPEPTTTPKQKIEPPTTPPMPEPTTTPEQKTEPQNPPEVKRPETIPVSQPKVESTPTPQPKVETTPQPEAPATEPKTSPAKDTNVDPVERIKKAKELLDLGAITQEDFDKIKAKYLDEI